jgi:hypothetical protein
VAVGPVGFAKLPDIDNISVQDDNPGLNTFQIMKKFFGVAAIGSQVKVRYYEYIDLPFMFFHEAG